MKTLNYLRLSALFFFNFLFYLSFTQNLKTATIFGKIMDSTFTALPGAHIELVNPLNTLKYSSISDDLGNYKLENIKPGTALTLSVIYIGFNEFKKSEILLNPGQRLQLDIVMSNDPEGIIETKELKDKKSILNKDRMGTSYLIRKEILESFPSRNRSLDDFLKYIPQAKVNITNGTGITGTSFTGQDMRFNNFTIDGMEINDRFGISGIYGNQNGTTPISLDALQELEVQINPFNSKYGGMTGAYVNATPRSAGNKLQGSVFYNNRNNNLIGSNADGTSIIKNGFLVNQLGGRVSFPLIKDKLFAFINFEQNNNSKPGNSFIANTGKLSGNNISRVTSSNLIAVSNFLRNIDNSNDLKNRTYNTGSFDNYSLQSKNNKAYFKLDYNINPFNSLSLSFNHLQAETETPPSNTGVYSGHRQNSIMAMHFANSNNIISTTMSTGILKLNTILGRQKNMANELSISYLSNNDSHNSIGADYPSVDILKNGSTYISLGQDPLTPNLDIQTKVIQIKNDFSFYKGRHKLNGGFQLESVKNDGIISPYFNGHHVYDNIESFSSAFRFNKGIAKRFILAHNNFPPSSFPEIISSVLKPSWYAQDNLNLLKNRLNINFGLRVEIPVWAQNAKANPLVEKLKFSIPDKSITSLHTDQLPSSSIILLPRIGFNYELFDDRKLQIRGGLGVFVANTPLANISNQIFYNGLYPKKIQLDSTFTNYILGSPLNDNLPFNDYNLAITDTKFKFPQVIKLNLAGDLRLPFGLIGTLEGIVSKNLNQPIFVNINQANTTVTYKGPDKRMIYPGLGLAGESLNKALRINDNITDAIFLTNTNKGYYYSLTSQIQKELKTNLSFSLSYTYAVAKDLMSTGTNAYETWSNILSVNGNNHPDLSNSDYDQRQRIIGMLYYKRPDKYGSTGINIGLISGSQSRVSYTVNGDMNGDGLASNDLMYIPEKASDLVFQNYTITNGSLSKTITVSEQQLAFDAFLKSNTYLSKGGRYTTRNGFVLPWLTTIDLSVIRDINFNVSGKSQTIQIRLDAFNIGNMIKNNWGVATLPITTSPLEWVTKNASNQPVYRFTPIENGMFGGNGLPTKSLIRSSGVGEVWQVGVGVRYVF